MGKIDCVCIFEDKQFEMALEAMLTYSGIFNVFRYENNPPLSYEDSDNPLKSDDNPRVLFSDLDDEGLKERVSGSYEDVLLLLRVYKYMPFSELLGQVKQRLDLDDASSATLASPRQLLKKGRLKKIGVYSAGGGAGSTKIAKGISRIFYRDGYKVLYLDSSVISLSDGDKGAYKDGFDNQSLTRLLYYLNRGRRLNIEDFTDDDGPYFLRRSICERFLGSLDVEMINALECEAIDSGFDILVLDMGSRLDEKTMLVLKNCFGGVCVLPNDFMINERIACHLKEIKDIGPNGTLTVINKYEDGKSEAGRSGTNSNLEMREEIDLMIPNYEVFDERSLDHDFGNRIRYLTDRLLNR